MSTVVVQRDGGRKPRPIRAKPTGGQQSSGRYGSALSAAFPSRRRAAVPQPADGPTLSSGSSSASSNTVQFLQSCLDEHPHQRDGLQEVQEDGKAWVETKEGVKAGEDGVDSKSDRGGVNVKKPEEAPPEGSALREVVSKFTRDQKSTREVLFLQQQFFQEDSPTTGGDGGSGGAGPVVETPKKREVRLEGEDDSPRHAGGGPNKLPWRFNSPNGHSDGRRRSPSFRRTPGASRPAAPRPHGMGYPPSWGAMGGGGYRPNPPFWNGSRSFFQAGPSPTKMLYVSDLCGDGVVRGPGEGDGPQEGVPMMMGGPRGAVQLMVSNLDYNISAREWKKILTAEFQQHVQVLSAYIQTQADNTNVAYIQVASTDEARYAISQFHRKKIGYKRIHVSLINHETNSTAANSRSEVVALLKEVTGSILPLFKFIEMFEKRYHRGISVSELYRMRDTIEIEEQGGTGRTVALLVPGTMSSAASDGSEPEMEELESPVCKTHCSEGSAGYVAALDSACLPNVVLQLKSFSAQVHTLLQTHDGSMPLMSFQSCYENEFRSLPVSLDGGVPLEHLISCVPGVKVAITKSGVKKIQWAENKPPPSQDLGRTCSPLMTQQLSQFSREVVDLLKHTPQCRMSFSKFIPAYHHHFGRQCRVADYGYTKLMELFEAIPHVVQIIGSGSRRFVTLSHRTQVKRFTADLLRVLKSQASKQINIMDMPIVYNKVICKAFDITDYGVCYIEDILSEVPESTVLVQGVGQKMVILIPRREQTLEEAERTKQFAVEVVDLLRHSPQCRMPFNKFIPAYHHHFGKQCRVADYGFTKLIELFESIPHILKIEDEDDDKMLCLTEGELVHVLEDQVTGLLRSCAEAELPVPEFLNAFMRFHGHSVRLQDFGVSSVCELVQLIPNTAMIENSSGRAIIQLVDHSEERKLACQVLRLLMDKPKGSMTLEELRASYLETFKTELLPESLQQLDEYLQIAPKNDGAEGVPAKDTTVRLTTLQMFARDVRTVLQANKGRLALQHFDAVYAQHFGVSLVPPAYGYPSVCALLQAVPHMATIRGKGYRRLVLLTPEFQAEDENAPPMQPSVNIGAMVPCQQTSVEPDTDPDMEPCTEPHAEPCTEPCTDSTCSIHGHGVCVTSPSNDSGITELHDFSPTDSASPPESDTKASVEKATDPAVTKHKVCKAQRQLSFDPGNIPVPEMFSKYGDELGQEPKTPSSEMLHMAAQFLPQDVRQAAYPNEYGLHGPGFTYPDHPFLALPPQCVPVHEAYQGYVSYDQYRGHDYYVTSAPLQGYDSVKQGSDLGVQEGKFTLEYPGGYPGSAPAGGMYVIASGPSSPPPYPPPSAYSHVTCGEQMTGPLQGRTPIVPITCESLEAGCPEMAESGSGMSLEKASVKLKDLCMSAPPPTLSPLQQCFPMVDDNNNDLRGMVKDAELERRMLTNPNVSEGRHTEMAIGASSTSASSMVHQNSPRKTRLAARFHRQPSPSSTGKTDISVASGCKLDM